MQNTIANECFVDEIAAAIDVDPLEFRVKYADPADKRGLEVIRQLGKLAKWGRRAPPQKNISGNIVKGRGCSYVKYELVRTYVGAVAEVEVNRATGDIRVAKFYIVHDCGQIINPNGVRAQIEGSVIQTVSRGLKEEVTFDRGMVTSLDWASYPILTFPEVPEIVIELIDRPMEKPLGGGRAPGGFGLFSNLKCRLRCDRRASSLGAFQAREGESSFTSCLRMRSRGNYLQIFEIPGPLVQA
jgi:nicotinate dehydrogenase subunit B